MSQGQLYWEDVAIGNDLPAISKVATTQMLVKWAGACGDFDPLHYDFDYATAQGFNKPIVHGPLKRAWLIQLVTDWIGERGFLKWFSCQFRAVDYPRSMKGQTTPDEGETWHCRGRVTRKYVESEEHCVECEIWVENGEEKITTQGFAIVVLPSKAL